MYLRCLLFELCSENSQVFLEITDRDFLFFHSFMFFQKLVKQHGVDLFVAHGVDFSLLVPHHELRINLCNLLGYEPELRDTLRIDLLLVSERDRLRANSVSLALFIGLMSSLKRRDDVVVPSLPAELM